MAEREQHKLTPLMDYGIYDDDDDENDDSDDDS